MGNKIITFGKNQSDANTWGFKQIFVSTVLSFATLTLAKSYRPL